MPLDANPAMINKKDIQAIRGQRCLHNAIHKFTDSIPTLVKTSLHWIIVMKPKPRPSKVHSIESNHSERTMCANDAIVRAVAVLLLKEARSHLSDASMSETSI